MDRTAFENPGLWVGVLLVLLAGAAGLAGWIYYGADMLLTFAAQGLSFCL
ncbi:hypothetical protein ACQ3G6_10500 [Allorhizobium undicola]